MSQNINPIHRIYLTTEQAAKIAQMSTQTFTNWRYQRKGPPWVKVGGAVRYEEGALYRWLDAQTVEEIPPASGM